MKTLVDIDDRLLELAMKLSRAATKKETIRQGLEELVRASRRRSLKEKAGSGLMDLTLSGLRRSRQARGVRLRQVSRAGR